MKFFDTKEKITSSYCKLNMTVLITENNSIVFLGNFSSNNYNNKNM